MASDCLFCKIVEKDIPATILFEDQDVVVFRDIDPKAPTHVLVVPKQHYPTMMAMVTSDAALAAKVLATAGSVALEQGIADSGYRTVFNTGDQAGQSVHHVHAHVLGGRSLTWPPG